jgi:PII-like signaling protein
MRIHIGESGRGQKRPLYEAVVQLFPGENFRGVTVLGGVGGYGSASR